MRLTRRALMTGGIAGVAMLVMSWSVTPAWALTADQAKAHVQTTINELVALLRQPGPATSRAPRLRQIMETRGNLPQIARFSAGRLWREMDPQQQQRFTEAFAQYVANTYARRFSEYSGDPQISVGQVINAGQKGFLVATPIRQPKGQPVAVEWLVTDRGGRVEIVDIVIENVSMAATQREEIASMFDRQGSIDALITHLSSAG